MTPDASMRDTPLRQALVDGAFQSARVAPAPGVRAVAG
jgi:hypothetical protein